jgi:putative acetyltransferase
MVIREEQIKDIEQIWQVNTAAFVTDAEATLVNLLRDSGCTFISMVAETDNKIVGHILFTPVSLTGDKNRLKLMGLAPMAVLPEYQNQGIGSQLVETGLQHCRDSGYDAVVVLGHPNYYPRFGFVPSVNYGIKSEYEVADDVFMIIELVPGSLKNHTGIIRYHDAFNNV